MKLNNVDWESVLLDAATFSERAYQVKLLIDRDISREIAVEATKTLQNLKMTSPPNVAKVAGHVTFWIRKLKPLTHAQDSPKKFLAINELVSVLVGIGICRTYFDDTSGKRNFRVPNRVMTDWIMSLRRHSHSPNSCALLFEFLASEN